MKIASNKLLNWHRDIFDIYQCMLSNKIVASYIGPFDRTILISLGLNLKNTLWENTTQAKKFFKIFVELAHNISLYSIERELDSGIGTFILTEDKEYFQLISANMVNVKQKEHLASKLELINSLNRAKLRELKRKLLSSPSKNGDTGNIGLIQTALISRHPLAWKFIPTSFNGQQAYFYILGIRLNKEHYKND